MKKLFLLIFLALAGVLTYFLLYSKKNKPTDEAARPQPVAVSRYSDAFNASLNNAMNSYYSLSESFVNWDSAGVRTNSIALKGNLNAIQFNELQKDTAQSAAGNIKTLTSELNAIINEQELTARRQTFHSFSQKLFDLLKTVRYDATIIYLQECKMPFNDTGHGIWLSKTSDIRNPYLGLHHPKYKTGMLECGETKDSLDFMTSAAKK
ncbi:MAG: DUF3347 domain-containing protein [Chitinophagaceae bacterium]